MKLGGRATDIPGTELALDALEMAIWSGENRMDDQRVRYTPVRFIGRTEEIGIAHSVGQGEIPDIMQRLNLSAAFKNKLIDQGRPVERSWGRHPCAHRRPAGDPEGRHDEFSAALQ
jgi:hypothetical protein